MLLAEALQALPRQFGIGCSCRRLQRRGIVRKDHEGPRDFASRVIAARPDLRTSVSAIAALYIGIRYGRQDSKENRRRFDRLVRSFHP